MIECCCKEYITWRYATVNGIVCFNFMLENHLNFTIEPNSRGIKWWNSYQRKRERESLWTTPSVWLKTVNNQMIKQSFRRKPPWVWSVLPIDSSFLTLWIFFCRYNLKTMIKSTLKLRWLICNLNIRVSYCYSNWTFSII